MSKAPRIIELRSNGRTLKEICKELNCSVSYCSKVLKEAGMTSPIKRIPDSKFIRMIGAGYSIRRISKELNISWPAAKHRVTMIEENHEL